MHSFNLKLSTELIFGKGRHLEIADVVKRYGKKNVLIIYGQSFALRSGLLETTTELFDEQGIDYVLFGGVTPNPEVHFVREAKKIAKEYEVDLILAIGGGSVIDVAKAVAVAFYHDGDELDFNRRLLMPTKALPVGVILTHASAGSEMSTSCVISDAKNTFKQGFHSELNRPLFAITNPELTYSLSPYQTAVGIVDSFMHTLERYFGVSEPIELSDRFAEGLFITLVQSAKQIMVDIEDELARANIMLASTFSHNHVTGLGKKISMPAHALEHALSALYPEIAHGHGLAIIYPAWLRFNFERLLPKLDQFARTVFGLNYKDKRKNAEAGINELSELFSDLGLSLSLRSVGVKEDDIDILANIVTDNGTKEVKHTVKNLTKSDIIKIYENCY